MGVEAAKPTIRLWQLVEALLGVQLPALRIIADVLRAECEADPSRALLAPGEITAMLSACLGLSEPAFWIETLTPKGELQGLHVRLVPFSTVREERNGRVHPVAVHHLKLEGFSTSRRSGRAEVRMLPPAFVAFDKLGQPVGQFAFAVRMDCEVVECELFDEWAFRLSAMLTWALPAIRSEVGRRRR